MLHFTKMQGLGNDYIYIDNINHKIENEAKLARKISDRHFGVGADGLILICKSDIADFKMKMFNSDGSQAEMCGNGIRCVGKFVYDKKLTNKTTLTIETLAGIKTLTLNVKNDTVKTVTVDMGEPILAPKKIPVLANKEPVTNLKLRVFDKEFVFTCVSMGNPHAITVIEDEIDKFNVKKYGKALEINPIFPNKTNVEFVKIIDKENVKMRVWERGSGETLACGTGACATAVACHIKGYTNRKVTVQLLGGNLQIDWNEKNNHVYMTGPATTVFEGDWGTLQKSLHRDSGTVLKSLCRDLGTLFNLYQLLFLKTYCFYF